MAVGDDVMSTEPCHDKGIELEAKKCVMDEELPVDQSADVVDDTITTSVTTEGKNSNDTGKLFFTCT